MERLEQKRFNYLIAITPLFLYKREWVWLCKCDCGKQTNVRISKLKNGTTKSCGCFKAKNIKNKSGPTHKKWRGYEDISMSFYNRMKQTALQRGIEFNITIEYLWKLFQEQKGLCAYTGNKIFLPINVRQLRGEGNEMIASLDRIDSSIGYVDGNLQWLCKRVNYMKHTMNNEYFLSWIKSIYEFKIKKY